MTITGVTLVTAGWQFKNGIYQTARKVLDEKTTYVCMGDPSTLAVLEVVSVGDITAGQVPATAGTNRARDETLTCEVVVSVSQGGLDDAQLIVDERAWEIAAQLEQAVHYAAGSVDGTLLGGVVRECFVTSVEQIDLKATIDNAEGRNCTLTVTFTGKARIQWHS